MRMHVLPEAWLCALIGIVATVLVEMMAADQDQSHGELSQIAAFDIERNEMSSKSHLQISA